jgi:hypothetical protein
MVRPKLPDSKRRSEVFQLRFTKGERELLDQAVEPSEIPLSDLIRDAALEGAAAYQGQ